MASNEVLSVAGGTKINLQVGKADPVPAVSGYESMKSGDRVHLPDLQFAKDAS